MADNTIFITLGILHKHPEKTMLIRSILPPGSYKTSLDASPPPILLSLHCKQINKVQNELDGQPSSFLASMHVSNYKATSSLMNLMFLELDTHLPHLEPQTYRLKKLTEIEAFFLHEIEVREETAKKMKRFNTITGVVDTGSTTSTVITGGISIAAFTNGVCLKRN